MDFLGIGPLELVFVLFIVILVFGPDDLVKTGKTIGRFLNKVVRSDSWRAVREVNRELRDLPNRLAKEAELESALKETAENTISPPKPNTKANQEETKTESNPETGSENLEDGIKAWTTPPDKSANPPTSSTTSDEQKVQA
jgi:Sec-independent protein translocase protein TatA